MELGTIARLIAFIAYAIVSLTTDPVQAIAKCRGKWRIHACFGGNGKRSDPRLTSTNTRPLTVASKLRDVRHQQALQASMHRDQRSHHDRQSWSLLEALLPETQPSAPHTLSANSILASRISDFLQDTEQRFGSEERDAKVRGLKNRHMDNFDFGDAIVADNDDDNDVDDVSAEDDNDEVDTDQDNGQRVSVDSLRDLITVLTLQRTLRNHGLDSTRLTRDDDTITL